MRPIDADRLKDTLKQLDVESNDIKWKSIVEESVRKIFPQIIDDEPTADVEPVKHSHWFYPFSELDINRCWECGMHVQDKINNVRETFKYCPHCGAKMDDIEHRDLVDEDGKELPE